MSESTTKDEVEPQRGFRLPSAYTILFALIVVMAIATWLIPAGAYDTDKEGAPLPGTYHTVDSHPARIITDSLTAPINGLYGIEDAKGNINYYNSGVLFGAIDVALFIIVIGGFLGVTMRTGAIQSGIARLVSRLKGRERWMIPILMTVFALGGTTYGMAEESLAFYSLVIAVMIAAGYDALTGAAVVLLGCGIGTYGSTINPFATGIASGFADTSISQGLILRLVLLVLGLVIGIFFVLRYADRVKKDPSRSAVAHMREENEVHFSVDAGEGADAGVMNGRHKAILVVFGLAFGVMMYGVIPWEDLGIGVPTLWWWFPEMTASFILFSIIIGVIGRMPELELTTAFVDGARDLLGVALIIGIARGITVVMNNGQITDTVLHWAEQAVGDVGEAGFRGGGVPDVPAAVVPDSLLLRPGHRGDADHEPVGVVRRRPVGPRGHGVPERLGDHEPLHPDVGGRDGWACDRARALRHLPPLGLAAAGDARRAERGRTERGRVGGVTHRGPQPISWGRRARGRRPGCADAGPRTPPARSGPGRGGRPAPGAGGRGR